MPPPLPIWVRRPMDVAVDRKSGYRWLRPAKKPSVLGGGLLERARSTTLALLGATTAVGLAMVALALNQSWPVIADSPLPVGPPRHEAVGEASVAAGAIANAADPSPDRAEGSLSSGARRSDRGGSSAPADGSAPTAPELVVAPSAPAERGGDAPGADEPSAPPSPAAETPQAPAAPVPVSSAPALPKSAPPSPPTAETPPPLTSAEVQVDSSDGEGEEDDWDDDDGDWDDDRSGDRGYGRGGRWSRGHHGD